MELMIAAVDRANEITTFLHVPAATTSITHSIQLSPDSSINAAGLRSFCVSDSRPPHLPAQPIAGLRSGLNATRI